MLSLTSVNHEPKGPSNGTTDGYLARYVAWVGLDSTKENKPVTCIILLFAVDGRQQTSKVAGTLTHVTAKNLEDINHIGEVPVIILLAGEKLVKVELFGFDVSV